MTSSPSAANIDLAQYFFDTSALVKNYHSEAGSEAVDLILASSPRVVRISELGAVEIHSALAVKARTGHLTESGARALSALVLRDIARGISKPHGVTSPHFAHAEELVFRFGYNYRLGSFDAVHLAVASDLRNGGLVDFLVTADLVLETAATIMGFAAINPQRA